MSKTNNLKDYLTDLADAIRAKQVSDEKINPQDFRSCVEALHNDLEAEQYGVVAKKGNTALIEKVNAALDELLVKDSSGKNQIDKWFEKYSAIEPAE